MKKSNKIILSGIASTVLLASAIIPPVVVTTKVHQNTSKIKDNIGQSKLLNAKFSNNKNNNQELFNADINNLNYTLNLADFTATINGFANLNKKSVNLIIPNIVVYKDVSFKVTNVATSAFYNKGLLSVVLSDNLQSIGANAFANNYLNTVKFPLVLTSLGDNSFSNNCFKYGTVIYLPANCTWNKSTNFSPFNTNNNFSKFTSVVQFIIQNQAVYQYLPNQLGWTITSYLPSVAALNQNKITESSTIFNNNEKTETSSQSPYKPVNYKEILPALQSTNLENSAIYLKNGNSLNGLISFNSSAMKMKFNSLNDSSSILNNNSDIKWNFQVYNLTNNNYEIDQSFGVNLSSIQVSQLFNGSSDGVKFHYGDVISMNNPGSSLGGGWINVATNYNSSILSSQNPLNELNDYYNLGLSWTQKNNNITNFIITPQGLEPYVNVTHVNPIQILSSNLNTSENFNVTGTTISRTKVSLTILNKTFTGVSNAEGHFSVSVNFDKEDAAKLTSKTSVIIQADGTLPVSTHLLGINPLNSGILFNVGKSKKHMVILFNGETGRLQLWNGSANMPSFTNNNEIWNNSSLSNDDTALNFSDTSPENSVFYIKVTNSENQATAQYHKISLSNEMTIADLATQIEKISFQIGDVLTLLIPYWTLSDVWMYQLYSNNKSMPFGYEISDFPTLSSSYKFLNFQFKIEKSGLKNLINKNWNSQYTTRFSRTWNANSYMIATNGGDGGLEDDNQYVNFYNPSPTMKRVVEQITSGLATNYEKAIAIQEWVAENMHYTFKYDYGHTINGTFNHLEGVCGNFAALAAVMCQMAGLVSRVAIGYAVGGVNYWSQYWDIDHAWTEVWLPSLGEWVTLDPTWDWFGPLGQVQSSFNLGRSNIHLSNVFWPKGTNYFSYFKGHEYEALSFLGTFYDIQANQGPGYYSLSSAAALAALFNKTSSLNATDKFASIND